MLFGLPEAVVLSSYDEGKWSRRVDFDEPFVENLSLDEISILSG